MLECLFIRCHIQKTGLTYGDNWTCTPSLIPMRLWICRRTEGTVLLPRNVQAFRTVFNITHALFEHLSPQGWRIVLTSLSILDDVLCSPSTTILQKAPITSATLQKSSDLSVLESATTQLFATSEHASSKTVCDMMHVLCELSESTEVFAKVRLCSCKCPLGDAVHSNSNSGCQPVLSACTCAPPISSLTCDIVIKVAERCKPAC
jgi:hypothetical protein